MLVDADPQASAATWADSTPAGRFPFSVLRLPSKTLHAQLDDFARENFNAIVIDTPPLEQQTGIVTSALRVASMVVVPVAPTSMEIERIYAVGQVLDDAAGFRRDGLPVPARVLFTRVVPNAASTEAYRAQLTADGFHVLGSTVHRLERYGQAYADDVINADATAYGEVVRELLAQEVVA